MKMTIKIFLDHFDHFGPENKLKRVQITPKMLKTCRNLPKFTFCAMYNILHHAFYAQVHIVYTLVVNAVH